MTTSSMVMGVTAGWSKRVNAATFLNSGRLAVVDGDQRRFLQLQRKERAVRHEPNEEKERGRCSLTRMVVAAAS
jgi:hypothetical protein